MRNNDEIICRVVRSYKMMLGFYGMRLLSDTGLLARTLLPRDFKSRYRNLLSKCVYKCALQVIYRMVRKFTQQSTHHTYSQVLV